MPRERSVGVDFTDWSRAALPRSESLGFLYGCKKRRAELLQLVFADASDARQGCQALRGGASDFVQHRVVRDAECRLLLGPGELPTCGLKPFVASPRGGIERRYLGARLCG